MRQRDFEFELKVNVSVDGGEAGVTVYSCENEHYEAAVRKNGDSYEAVLKLNIGGIKHIQTVAELKEGKAEISISANNFFYEFKVNGVSLGGGQTKYLSSEVSGGFTGVMLGLYAVGENIAEFNGFEINYK